MIDIAATTIDFQGSGVFADDLKVDRANFKCAGLILHKLKSTASPPAAAMRFPQVKLVDEGIASEIFKAVAEGEYHVADRVIGLADQLGPAEGRVA